MELHQFRLPNGIPVIIHPMPRLFSAQVQVNFQTGSRHEPKRLNGISHFIEHLMGKGGSRYPSAAALDAAVDNVGGRANGDTQRECMRCWVFVPDGHEDIEVAFSTLADMLITPRFSQEDIDHERGSVLQEIAQYIDIPLEVADAAAHHLFFGAHSLGRPVEGTAASVSRMTREDIVSYFAQHFIANIASLVVAGNIDIAQCAALAEQFAAMHRGNAACSGGGASPATPRGAACRIVRKDIEQARLELMFPAFARSHPLRKAAVLAVHIAGSGPSSRLFRVVRGEEGLAYEIGAELTAERDYGHLTVFSDAPRGRLGETLRLILGELRKLARGPIDDGEHERAKKREESKIKMRIETAGDACETILGQFALDGIIRSPEERIADIQRIRKSEIEEAAHALVFAHPPVLVVVGNVKETEQELLDIIENA